MKVRKIVTLLLTIVLTGLLSAQVFAARKDLPVQPNWVNIPQQRGWATDEAVGQDNVDTAIGLTLAELQSAEYLVIELNSPFTDASPKIGVSTESAGWKDGDFSSGSGDELIVKIYLPDNDVWKNVYDAEEWARFEIQNWTEDWIDIKAVYLDGLPESAAAPAAETTPAATTPAATTSGDNPVTGENSYIILAVALLALSVCGVVFINRKAKAQ